MTFLDQLNMVLDNDVKGDFLPKDRKELTFLLIKLCFFLEG